MEGYGREFRGGMGMRGYGRGYDEYGARRRWTMRPPRRPYGAEFGEEERWDGYDYEFGGRGWPYEYRTRGRRFGWTGWPGPVERERWRPAGYGYGRRRMRRHARPRRREWHPVYGAEFDRDVGYGYGRVYHPRRDLRGMARYAGRLYGPREEPRYGFTPSSRWPEDGHDLDHLGARERAMTDEEVRDVILENLFQDSFVDPRDIHVDVENGVVTLAGDVRDYMEARYVWDDAWESPGVRGVINNLTVRTDRPAEEMELPQTSGRTLGRAMQRRHGS